ncbi:EF-hand calcium-binding domain-containing protein 4B isoform X1 [Corvus cornix cornix]|uniref:EF-hand calcium-binding domain-containing protein 4B isoform X1 n=1 Tax=Corvus brachyrhynchos TaxID=85066 RepID=UPI0004DE0D37|nr:PREDICTED: EF-hand calcium-binding domain-containing protein 4B isoform X1 [Corvus brachyrhynchos]XP_017591397.1 PREDICTED: EF-hand calcium-binding domain-containing protein 4B isoform X1 [Corvus brachyrhynchos]XP_039416794.1 EF-hand calcium-binding domain-containing protein 4B isoform X1 [Corvus cornix cornix]XP_039416804.1 EF-hand calcium-binding domain-containing protein 4B isoform X1 [Corvus cornix cornix]XP_039416812.1 EF-hand calcium-binding domain-containing protein 4B isoform X1 [Cor
MDRIKGDCTSPVQPGDGERSRTGEQDPELTVLGKAQEFFQICDLEGKGFVTCQDMQRLHPELPLSLEELEKVFVTLDADGNGSLTPKEFITGFSQFLLEQIALKNDMVPPSEGETAGPVRCEETMSGDEDEEFQFSNLMDRLGAKKVLDDESDVKQLWLQLRKEEPHLLSNFEEFLVRIFSQLQEADNEKNELECALKKKIAAYDEEMQHLYEEMEQQIKKEKEQFLLKDTERFQSYSQELECKLLSKEQELEQLVQKQKRLEHQCTELLSGKEETKVENTKLKLTNQELLRDLERTSHELSLAQQQLQVLQEEASRLSEEKEMEVYRVTETLQREKSGLLKQLDFLRERNKHLKDERDIFLQKCKTTVPKASWKQRSGSIIGKYIEGKMLPNSHSFEEDDIFSNSKRRNSAGLNGVLSEEPDSGVTGGMPKTSHLQRIISIEEDHLPQLLDRLVDKQLSRWTGEDENTSETQMNNETREHSMEHSSSSSREQPVGKETLPNEERINSVPERLFKIIFVGNSSVGKTSFLRRFCEDRFFPGTAATVGVDYNVRTVAVDHTQVALQLWDTAGQERYRSITKQFFRKADGVIVMYDITAKDTFTAVKQWLISIEEASGENVPVLLLGNKTDNEKEREVPMGMGDHLAKDYNLIFYECSAYSGYNVEKSVLHLARILKEHEDKVKEKTIELQSDTNKKSCCIRQ